MKSGLNQKWGVFTNPVSKKRMVAFWNRKWVFLVVFMELWRMAYIPQSTVRITVKFCGEQSNTNHIVNWTLGYCSHKIAELKTFLVKCGRFLIISKQSSSDTKRLSPDHVLWKKWPATQCFEDDEVLTADINEWLKSQTVEFYNEGIQKLVNSYNKCLHLNEDYVEK